jgi:hypothetical protein
MVTSAWYKRYDFDSVFKVSEVSFAVYISRTEECLEAALGSRSQTPARHGVSQSMQFSL